MSRYGDNFANLGSVNNSAPGTYLMRLANDAGTEPGVELTNATGSEYKGFVNFPTTYGFLLIRILLETTEATLISCTTTQISLSLVNRTSTNPFARGPPSLKTHLLNDSISGSSAQQILQLTVRLSPYNPTELRSDLINVTHNLKLAGIANGVYHQPLGVNLTEAVTAAGNAIAADLYQPESRVNLGHDWVQYKPDISGNYISDFAARAYIASNALGQLLPYEASYPEYVGEDQAATLFVGAHQATIFTLSAKPPVTGFWSLTAYDSNNYLIPNGLNRYALGDRSNLTYADGEIVYADPNSNRPLQILMQPVDVTPPANWTYK